MEIKAQLKIQEMAFVIIAVIVFFALVGVVFFAVHISSLKNKASSLSQDQSSALVRKISSLPELNWKGCAECLDLDKAIVLASQKNNEYSNLLEADYLAVDIVYPQKKNRPCIIGSYPDCSRITIINKSSNYGTTSSAFVTLCHWDSRLGQEVCELGKAYISGGGAG